MKFLLIALLIPSLLLAEIIIKSNYPLDSTNLEEVVKSKNIEIIVKLIKKIDRVKDVRIHKKEDKVVLFIELYPIIEKINIKGNFALWDSTIMEHTGLRIGIPYKDLNEEIIKMRIKHLYIENGFIDAYVHVKVSEIKGKVFIDIKIKEGDIYFIYKPSFQGNKSISYETLRYVSGLKVGSIFDPEEIQSATLLLHDFYVRKGFWDSFVFYRGYTKRKIEYTFLQALLPGFERVKQEPLTIFGTLFEGASNIFSHPIAMFKALTGKGKGVIAEYKIIEGAKYEVDFEGNKFFTNSKLKEFLTLSQKGVDIFSLEENVNILTSVYTEKGFFDVKVNFKWERGKNSHKITFTIQEGNRYKLKLITPGNELELPFIEFYDEEVIKKVEDSILKALKEDGFLLAEIERVTEIDRENSIATVRLKVKNKYKLMLKKFLYAGKDKDIKDIFDKYNGSLPAIYSTEIIRKLDLELEQFFRDKGYMNALYTKDIRTENRQNVIYYTYIYKINKGERYKYGKTLIYGYDKIKLSEIKSMILEAKYFSEKNEDKTFRVFVLSEIFSDVSMDYIVDHENKKVHRIIELRESERGFFDTAVGYNTEEGITGEISVGFKNITGYGIENRIKYRRSNLYETYSFTVKDNFLLSYRFTGEVSVFKGIRLHKSYDVQSVGYSLSLGYRIIPDIVTGVTFSSTNNKVFREESGNYKIDKVGIFFFREYRDKMFSPSKFHYNSIHIYRSINEPIYYKAELTSFYLLQITANISIDFKVALGAVDKKAPIFERFFLGGLRDLRGFSFEEIGQPLGGYYYAFGRFEFIFPIKGIIRGILFTDSGKVADDIEEFKTKFLTDGGFALAVETPVGPIRIDVAKPIDKLGDFSYPPIVYLYIGYAY